LHACYIAIGLFGKFCSEAALRVVNLLDIGLKNHLLVQEFVKKILLGQTIPTATRGGLLGFRGDVREIERSILGTLQDGKNAALTPVVQAYLNATVSQITRTLKAQGRLDPHF